MGAARVALVEADLLACAGQALGDALLRVDGEGVGDVRHEHGDAREDEGDADLRPHAGQHAHSAAMPSVHGMHGEHPGPGRVCVCGSATPTRIIAIVKMRVLVWLTERSP